VANLSFSAACRNPQAGMRGPVTELLTASHWLAMEWAAALAWDAASA
jgi:hypothetical protein